MDGWISGWMGRWMDGCVGGWADEQAGGCVDGWLTVNEKETVFDDNFLSLSLDVTLFSSCHSSSPGSTGFL